MADFDILKPWVIFTGNSAAAKNAALELASYIELLRADRRLAQKAPLIIERGEFSAMPVEQVPAIILHAANGRGNGFSRRMGQSRLEINGESGRGLFNGVFDFLAALGFRWKTPEQEELPPKNSVQPRLFTIWETENHSPSNGAKRYLLFDYRQKKAEAWILWAVRNKIDTLVFPVKSNNFAALSERVCKKAKKYELDIEAGGWDLPLLVPRKHYFFHREMFRMNEGKRDKKINFCPTSPETIKILSQEARKVFLNHLQTAVFHLWPARGHEKEWCSCPTCRAFTAEEQNRIAVNAAADVLREVNPSAMLSYYELSSEKATIALRPNVHKGSHPQADALSAETNGWFFAGKY